MVKIRLQRIGAKKQPKYRIVVIDEQAKRSGKAIEIIGSYDPMQTQPKIEVNKDRFEHWIKVGAQPTPAVINLLKRYERIVRPAG